MQLEIGKTYINKTLKYLLPTLKSYGSTFIAKYKSMFLIAVGIYDESLSGAYSDNKVLCLLVDRYVNNSIFLNVLNYFRNQSYYVTDYFFNGPDSRLHMIVFQLPKEWEEAYEYFLKGQYSQMYNDNQIKYLYGDDPEHPALDVLNRTDAGYARMIKGIKTSFNEDLTREDLVGNELDFPIEREKEVFNYHLVKVGS